MIGMVKGWIGRLFGRKAKAQQEPGPTGTAFPDALAVSEADEQVAAEAAWARYQHGPGTARTPRQTRPAPATADPLKAARDLLQSLPRDLPANVMTAVLEGRLQPEAARAAYYARVAEENKRLRARIRAAGLDGEETAASFNRPDGIHHGDTESTENANTLDHDGTTSTTQNGPAIPHDDPPTVGARRAAPKQEQEHAPAPLRADRTEQRARRGTRLEPQRPSGWRDASSWFIPRTTE